MLGRCGFFGSHSQPVCSFWKQSGNLGFISGFISRLSLLSLLYTQRHTHTCRSVTPSRTGKHVRIQFWVCLFHVSSSIITFRSSYYLETLPVGTIRVVIRSSWNLLSVCATEKLSNCLFSVWARVYKFSLCLCHSRTTNRSSKIWTVVITCRSRVIWVGLLFVFSTG